MSAPRLLAALAFVVTTTGQAGEIYGNIGMPGVMLGYAHPFSDSFTLRGDYATVGSPTRSYNEEGIQYDGKLKAHRGALFGDWFPFQGTFRFTLGVSSNDYRLDLRATGAGGTLTIGSTTYVTTANDRFDATIKFPKTTPYLGFGWGHQLESGLRFSADIGAMIGKPTITSQVSGPAASVVTQADIDQETAELRDGVGKVRAIPQLSIGIGYSF